MRSDFGRGGKKFLLILPLLSSGGQLIQGGLSDGGRGKKVLSMNRKEGHIVVRKYFERRKEVGTDSWGGVIIGLSHPFIHKKTSVAKCEESILNFPLYIFFRQYYFVFQFLS